MQGQIEAGQSACRMLVLFLLVILNVFIRLLQRLGYLIAGQSLFSRFRKASRTFGCFFSSGLLRQHLFSALHTVCLVKQSVFWLFYPHSLSN